MAAGWPWPPDDKDAARRLVAALDEQEPDFEGVDELRAALLWNLSPPRGMIGSRSALPRHEIGESVMDLNLVVLCGRLATEPELRVFDSGTRLIGSW